MSTEQSPGTVPAAFAFAFDFDSNGAVIYVGHPIDLETCAPLGPLEPVSSFARGGLVTSGGASSDTVPCRPPGEQSISASASGDILDRIDDAIEDRCACGCGRPLRINGASGFFFSQECQARWYAGQATDPADVYDRDDAAMVYVGRDGSPVPLPGVEDQTPDTLGPADDNVYGTVYRLECPHCLWTITYLPHFDDDDDCDRPSDECRVYLPEVVCPRCSTALPPTPYVAAVHHHGPILLFEMFDGTSRTSRRMPTRRLHRAPDRQHLIDLTWEIMRRELDRFTGSWRRSNPPQTGTR